MSLLKIITGVLVVAMAAPVAFADGNGFGRRGWNNHHGSVGTMGLRGNRRVLVQLERNERLIEESMRMARRGQIRMVYYKLRTIQMDIRSLPHTRSKSTLVEAVDVAMQKVTDPYLSDRQKIDIVLDCGRVALGAIDEMIDEIEYDRVPQLREMIGMMNGVVSDVRYGQERRAVKTLRKIARGLNRVNRGGQALRDAKETVRFVLEKLTDPYLSQREKVDIVTDCQRVFNDQIRQCMGGGHGGGGNLQRVFLGQTGHFSRGSLKSKDVNLNVRNSKRLAGLVLKAVDDGLFIKRIDIVFGNGTIQSEYDLTIRENSQLRVDLEGGRRNIRRIVVLAASNNLWGTKAALEVVGLR